MTKERKANDYAVEYNNDDIRTRCLTNSYQIHSCYSPTYALIFDIYDSLSKRYWWSTKCQIIRWIARDFISRLKLKILNSKIIKNAWLLVKHLFTCTLFLKKKRLVLGSLKFSSFPRLVNVYLFLKRAFLFFFFYLSRKEDGDSAALDQAFRVFL